MEETAERCTTLEGTTEHHLTQGRVNWVTLQGVPANSPIHLRVVLVDATKLSLERDDSSLFLSEAPIIVTVAGQDAEWKLSPKKATSTLNKRRPRDRKVHRLFFTMDPNSCFVYDSPIVPKGRTETQIKASKPEIVIHMKELSGPFPEPEWPPEQNSEKVLATNTIVFRPLTQDSTELAGLPDPNVPFTLLSELDRPAKRRRNQDQHSRRNPEKEAGGEQQTVLGQEIPLILICCSAALLLLHFLTLNSATLDGDESAHAIENAFLDACATGQLAVAQKIFERLPTAIDYRNAKGDTGLHLAIRANRVKIVRWMRDLKLGDKWKAMIMEEVPGTPQITPCILRPASASQFSRSSPKTLLIGRLSLGEVWLRSTARCAWGRRKCSITSLAGLGKKGV